MNNKLNELSPRSEPSRGTPSSEELRLAIVEENLLTFLVATGLSGVCMWFFAQPFGMIDMLISYGPFLSVNLAALWLGIA